MQPRLDDRCVVVGADAGFGYIKQWWIRRGKILPQNGRNADCKAVCELNPVAGSTT